MAIHQVPVQMLLVSHAHRASTVQHMACQLPQETATEDISVLEAKLMVRLLRIGVLLAISVLLGLSRLSSVWPAPMHLTISMLRACPALPDSTAQKLSNKFVKRMAGSTPLPLQVLPPLQHTSVSSMPLRLLLVELL